jgi:hypothetical protein
VDNPAGEVDHFPATDLLIRIYSDDGESSGDLASTKNLLPLSTLVMKRSKNDVDPKKQRAMNQSSFDAWKMSWNTKLGH